MAAQHDYANRIQGTTHSPNTLSIHIWTCSWTVRFTLSICTLLPTWSGGIAAWTGLTSRRGMQGSCELPTTSWCSNWGPEKKDPFRSPALRHAVCTSKKSNHWIRFCHTKESTQKCRWRSIALLCQYYWLGVCGIRRPVVGIESSWIFLDLLRAFAFLDLLVSLVLRVLLSLLRPVF